MKIFLFLSILLFGLGCTLLYLLLFGPTAQPIRAPSNRNMLYAWIKEHKPELHTELCQLPMDGVRTRLNAATGLTIGPGDPIESSCAIYLQALKADREAS